MPWRRLFPTLLIALLAASAGAADLPPQIPRAVLFGNPTKASPLISPDGTRLAYLAPSAAGVLNVWVRTLGKADDAMVTNDTHRGIRSHVWAEDGVHLLYQQDVAGDENWHVYSVDVATKVVRDLTPFQGIRAQNLMVDRHRPNEMLVGLNLRDRKVFDMYRVDLSTGAVVPDTQNPGDVVGWFTDTDFQIRAAFATNPRDGSSILRVRDRGDAPWRDLITWPFEENGAAIAFTADGRGLYVETSLGTDTSRLVTVDVASGAELETLAHNARVDPGTIFLQPESRVVQAVSFDYLRSEWQVLDPAVRTDFDALSKVHAGTLAFLSRDRADRIWIVVYRPDDGPARYYAYRRDTKQADFLFADRPELEHYTLASMKPLVIAARDGLELVSYLTVPVGVEARHLPLVLDVHGGPWARDVWGYSAEAQWLANRGYAVLQVNFRGSTGFGKKFLNAGNGQWGVGAMQHDLTDAVQWAIKEGIADPKRVAIHGGSYGGYATLAGLTFTPQLYACGVDIVGPSNVRTLLQAIPPYWAPVLNLFVRRIGDVLTDDALNRRISPLFHVDAIRAPLLIAQGANDPRVNIREADQMVAALRAKQLSVTYAVYTDEGHGFARPENRLDFYGRAEAFLARCLGGRAEASQPVPGANVELR